MGARPTPFDLALADLAEERFPAIREELAAAGRDPRDRDAFLLGRGAAGLVHDLRPDTGLGEGVAQLAALVHHGYLYWADGQRRADLPRPALEPLLAAAAAGSAAIPDPAARYVSVPPRLVWGEPVPGAPPEPLDGCFVHQAPTGDRRVLAVFGLHPERAGFTVAEVEGPRPGRLVRPDGSPPYSGTLPSADRADLRSLAGGEELLALGWCLQEVP